MDCLTLHAVTVILERPDLLRREMRSAYLERLQRTGIHLSERAQPREPSSLLSTHTLVAEIRRVNIMRKIRFIHFKRCQVMRRGWNRLRCGSSTDVFVQR